MPVYICPRCHRTFDQKGNFDQHLRRKTPCLITNEPPPPKIKTEPKLDDNGQLYFDCEHCGQHFTRASNMKRHIELRCKKVERLALVPRVPQADPVYATEQTLISMCDKMRNEFDEKIKHAQVMISNQNILNVLCIRPDDNYLDLLTEHFGDFHQALDFIRNCALSRLSGDRKLLNKIYFEARPTSEAPIRYLDKGHTQVEYLDENQHKVVDYKGQQLIRILANNLQKTYLGGVNYSNKKNSECSNKFLADYDLQTWNTHIYELADIKYQKKLFSQLDIPCIK